MSAVVLASFMALSSLHLQADRTACEQEHNRRNAAHRFSSLRRVADLDLFATQLQVYVPALEDGMCVDYTSKDRIQD
jgi:hypothetical protein